MAAFSGCHIIGPTGNYQLTANANDPVQGALSQATSTFFSMTVGAPNKLVFSAQPGDGQNGAALSTQPAVTIEDSGGNKVTTSTDIVALTSTPGPPVATLTCTGGMSVAAVAGVATFSGCQIVGPVGTYTLSATDSSDGASVTSAAFNLDVGSSTQLVFSAQPGGGANGAVWSAQPAVTIKDSGGNPTASTDTITLAISGSSGASLTCNGGSDSMPATAGVAGFSGCQIVGPTGTYTLTATDSTSGSVASATSTSFSVTVGAPSRLVFSSQPGGGQNGAPWSNQPAVTIEDSGGNKVTTSTDTVALAIASGPSGASLTCAGGSDTKAATAGVAGFGGCQIVGPVGTYTLTATDSTTGAVSAATSFVFTITVGAPTHLVFTTPPSGGPSGVAWATQPAVTIEDSGGNTVTTSTDTVTLAKTNGPSANFTCNGGPPSVAASAGVATFSGCQITGPAVFYTITASDPPLLVGPGAVATATVLITP